MDKLLMGKGREENFILLNKINRHGLIAGATGTGKTVSLKVLVEGLSHAGVPTILADVKGDLVTMAKEGAMTPAIKDRLDHLGIPSFDFENYPVHVWDIYQEQGLPLRVTISELGPLMLANILDLNDTQAGVLNLVFKLADEEGLVLIDLKDLRQVLTYVNDNKDKVSTSYGNVASQTVAAILRKLLVLENAGGDLFFGEPALDLQDLLKTNQKGQGLVNILKADKLITNPLLYSTLLLYLLSEIYETFPEVGDLDTPKLAFFFDEAHLLFKDTPKALQDKIAQVVRLIRSKGVGVFFITQNPLDLPEEVSSQLANRIIHQLRAYSPKELKGVKTLADTFRQDGSIDVKEALLNLKTGEALVSFSDEEGKPTYVDQATILPPHSSFKPLEGKDYEQLVQGSDLYPKYKEAIDRQSAYEVLLDRIAGEQALRDREEALKKREQDLEKRSRSRGQRSYVDKGLDSMFGAFTRTIGREIARGILGSMRKRR